MSTSEYVITASVSDSTEIIKIPLLTHPDLRDRWDNIRKRNEDRIGFGVDCSDLKRFVESLGTIFGKDVNQWTSLGGERVDVIEEEGCRITRKTGVYSGMRLKLNLVQPFFDVRLENSGRPSCLLDFGKSEVGIEDDESFHRLLSQIPYTRQMRLKNLLKFLRTKCRSGDTQLQKEAMQGLWELAIIKDFHSEIDPDTIEVLVEGLNGDDVEATEFALRAVWSMATDCIKRLDLTSKGAICSILALAAQSPDRPGSRQIQELARRALSVLTIDKCCSSELLKSDPDMKTLKQICLALPSDTSNQQTELNVVGAKLLVSIVQRDHDIRMALVDNDGLAEITEAFKTGSNMVQLCMAVVLATLIHDTEAMDRLNSRGEGYKMFSCCLSFLKTSLNTLKQEGVTPDPNAEESTLRDGLVGVKMCEACAEAVWGASHSCALFNFASISLQEIKDLAKLAELSAELGTIPVSRVTHSLAASLATLCSSPYCAERMMEDKESVAIKSLLMLLKREESLSTNGHVVAAACTGIAFLACHPIGAKGDDCLTGPYRKQLILAGSLNALLAALLHPPNDQSCKSIVEESAAIGFMYLSTMAGKLNQEDLTLLSVLLKSSSNLQMLEYLMAGMWILLRNPGNRRDLATAFGGGAEGKTDTEARVAEAIQVHELTEGEWHRQECDQMQSAGDEWGLESLVRVGENWLEGLSSSTSDSASSVLKLFEFLTASLCLFIISDDEVPEEKPSQVYHFDAKRGWWTVMADSAESNSNDELSQLMIRCLSLLSALLKLEAEAAWKVVQLSCVTLWNTARRSKCAADFFVRHEVFEDLIRIIQEEKWPLCLRNCASGFLQFFSGIWRYSEAIGLERVVDAFVKLVDSGKPLLELSGCRAIGRLSSFVSPDCPNHKSYSTRVKAVVAEVEGVAALCHLLQRLYRRYCQSDGGDERVGSASSTSQFERDMSTREALLEMFEMALIALLNLSVLESNREKIGRHGVKTLMSTSILFSEDRSCSMSESISQLAAAVLHNISLHHKNRTRLYKLELSGSVQTVDLAEKLALSRERLYRPKLRMPMPALRQPGRDKRSETISGSNPAVIERGDSGCCSGEPDCLPNPGTPRIKNRDEETGHRYHSSDAAYIFHKKLKRPLNHSWQPPSSLKLPNWNPKISEYKETKSPKQISKAAKLLTSISRTTHNQTKCPLMSKAISLDRPSTRCRGDGKIPLMVLDPTGRNKSEDVAFNVVMSPQRLRTVIGFDVLIRLGDGNVKRSQLTMFEHVIGSRVSRGLFDSYALPNGRSVFYHYTDGSVVNEQEIEMLPTPSRPTSIPTALQEGMPLTNVLDVIAKPPGSGTESLIYRPVPKLAPLPTSHCLPVEHPTQRDLDSFRDLRLDDIHLKLVVEEVRQTRTTTETEAVEREKEIKAEWTLPSSIFKNRIRECDAHAFFDTPKVMDCSFEKDWQRCLNKEKFSSMIAREIKNLGISDHSAAIKDLHDCLKQHYWTLCSSFLYFSAIGSGDLFHISLNSFTSFLDECGIVDAATKRSDCDTIFIVANFASDKKSPAYANNNEQALMRFEFMEALVRIAILKFAKNGEATDLAAAVDQLFRENILPNLKEEALSSPNDFRKERLYREDVDFLFKKHSSLLKAIYSRYRTKPVGGGLRYKAMKADSWSMLMEDADLIDAQFTLLDAHLCYLRSRMWVQDEVKDFSRYESLGFIDFLEALARAADAKVLPTKKDLSDLGYDNVFEWYRLRDTGVDGSLKESEAQNPDRLFRDKLEIFLDFVFRKLHYDPSQPESEFSHDFLTKMMKKRDKELGP